MRNIYLMAFLFLLVLAAGGRNLLPAESKTIPFSLDLGTKLVTEGLGAKEELTLSQKLSLPFLEFKLAQRPKEKLYNYGMLLYSDKLTPHFPVSLMAGKLTSSGLISKMNSPELGSTVSAGGTEGTGGSPPKINLLKASFVQSSVYSKPDSFFAELGYADKKGVLRKAGVAGFYDGQTFTSSVDILLNAGGVKAELCLGGGLYPYGQKKEDSWFCAGPFYHEGEHFCGLGQLSFSYKKLSSLLMINIYESPFGKFEYTWRTENSFGFRRFSFNFAGFLNLNKDVITSSGKTLSPLLQLKGGGQYQFVGGKESPVFIKTAFAAKTDINLTEDLHSLKTAASFKITGEKTNFNLGCKCNFGAKKEIQTVVMDFSNASVEAVLSRYIYSFKPQLKAKVLFEPDSKKQVWTFTEKIGLSCSWYDKKGILSIGGNADVTLIQKNEKNKEAYSAGAYIKLKFDWFSLKVDVGM